MEKIYIGTDHAGHEFLKKVTKILDKLNVEYDLIITDDPKDDYPDIGFELAKKVKENKTKGIAICGTGIGISLACNQIKGIRSSVCYDEYTVEMARRHNDLNMLALGARTTIATNDALLENIITKYINTRFEGERHQERINKIENYKGEEK